MSSRSTRWRRLAWNTPRVTVLASLFWTLPLEVFGQSDRLAAVVEGEIITESDLEWLIRYKGIVRREEQEERSFRLEILNQLVNEKLIALEAKRTPGISLSRQDVEAQFKAYRRRFESEEAFRSKLDQMEMGASDLRALIRRQLSVFRFLQVRFNPFIIVLPDEINAYYQDQLLPELRRNSQPIPPLELVSENIRDILSTRKTNQEVDRWVAERRRSARVSILLYREHSDASNLPDSLVGQNQLTPVEIPKVPPPEPPENRR